MAGVGMEVLFCATQNQIKSRDDAIVCAVHWNMISNGFGCIGTGEDIPQDTHNIKKSEILPRGWNDNQEVYTLKYCCLSHNDVFLLKIIRLTDGILLVNLLRVRDERVCDLSININDYTNEDLSSFESAYRNLPELQRQFKKNLLDGLKPDSDSERSGSHSNRRPEQRQDEDDPLRVPTRNPQRRQPPEWGESSDPFSIGRGDLDPLGAGRYGGGMLMDPRGRGGIPGPGFDPSAGLPGRLPRGAVPPGARFDPFGPPDVDGSGAMNPRGGRGGGRAGPGPDHLPPPGYDDMFM